MKPENSFSLLKLSLTCAMSDTVLNLLKVVSVFGRKYKSLWQLEPILVGM
jgi:hypothetical protein